MIVDSGVPQGTVNISGSRYPTSLAGLSTLGILLVRYHTHPPTPTPPTHPPPLHPDTHTLLAFNAAQRSLHRYPGKFKEATYTSLLRSVLEGTATIWDPYLKESRRMLSDLFKETMKVLVALFLYFTTLAGRTSKTGEGPMASVNLQENLIIFIKHFFCRLNFHYAKPEVFLHG